MGVINNEKITIGDNTFIPRYLPMDARSRDKETIEYYPSGEVKSIYLASIHTVMLPSGKTNAEYVTFYKEGQIHRIFPVYGKLSGYWFEEDEKRFLQESTHVIGEYSYRGMFSCICCYPSGKVKSLTIWPGESITIMYNQKKVAVKNGISFYEDGAVKAFEPNNPISIKHGTGIYLAYDPLAIGISGDYTSFSLYPNGEVRSLKTALTGICYVKENDKKEGGGLNEIQHRVQPEFVMGPYDMSEQILMSMLIEFTEDELCITDSNKHIERVSLRQIKETYLVTENIEYITCGECSSCSKCARKR